MKRGTQVLVLMSVIYGLALGAVQLWMRTGGFRLGWVETPSVPRGLYALRPAAAPDLRVGAYVCLLASARDAPEVLRESLATGLVPSKWRDSPLLKRIAGVAGDRVEYDADHVRINGHALLHSRILEHDSLGQRLPRPTYPLVLARGEVWLASDHDRAFDARYFGPVRLEALRCIAEPLWTF